MALKKNKTIKSKLKKTAPVSVAKKNSKPAKKVSKPAAKKKISKTTLKAIVKAKTAAKKVVKTVKKVIGRAETKPTKKVVVKKVEKATQPKIVVEKPTKIKVEKEVIKAPTLAPIKTSDVIKGRIKTVLISQPKPDNDKNPYLDLARRHNVKIDFRQFIKVEGVPARDFRQERINILDHNAVILTSRHAVDHYFRMCNEMRVTVPESMKYFCISESTAYYLQKYVQYRKRKIFFGAQTIHDLVDVIKKHREEKFLLPVSDVHKEQIVDLLDNLKITYSKAVFYRTVSANLSDLGKTLDYDVVIFFTPAGIKSLFQNFPNFKQGNIRIGAFGYTTARAVLDNKLRLDIHSPTPQAPSMTMALDNYLKEAHKK